MALLKPIYGSGRILGNAVYMKPTTIVDEAQIEIGFNIEIGFYSPSGEYVGSVSTSPDGASYINFELEEERIGGLKSFEFEIARTLDIPFYPLLECRFFIFGNHWYSGELVFKPNTDKRKEIYKYQGQGFWDYLKRNKMTKTYNNRSLSYIINDIVKNYLEIYTENRILYNPLLIQPPNIVITKLEIKKKDIQNTIEYLLDIANYDYNNTQYITGVNKDRHFYFLPVNNEVNYGFFEGYQYQNPDVKEDIKKVINQVNIYRTKENSSDTELVTTIDDLDSQGKYGVMSKNITIPTYLDDNSAIKVAQFMIEKNKEKEISIKIKNLETLTTPYPIGFYYLNNRINNYRPIIAEFEILSEWDFNISNTVITSTIEKVFSGRLAFKCETQLGSKGEYLEKELEEEINYPIYLDLWLAQFEKDISLKIYIWDIDDHLVTQELDIKVINDFHRQRINMNALDNIKKIRLEFISDIENTIYLDRLEVITRSWSRHNLILDKINYKLSRSSLLADSTFGNKVDTLVDKIKKIKDDQENIFDIFEKT